MQGEWNQILLIPELGHDSISYVIISCLVFMFSCILHLHLHKQIEQHLLQQ